MKNCHARRTARAFARNAACFLLGFAAMGATRPGLPRTPLADPVMATEAECWPGTWIESTNNWRVQLYIWDTNTSNPWVSVSVGSVHTNSGAGWYRPPNGELLALELRDSHGVLLPQKAGTVVQTNLPQTVPVGKWPRWHGNGGLMNVIGFRSSSPPDELKQFRLADVYCVQTQGVYSLLAKPAVYHLETNGLYLKRIDLPAIGTKLFLAPQRQKSLGRS